MAGIGNYRTPCTYQTLTSTNDGAGGTSAGTWTDEFTMMVEVKPMTGFKRLEYTSIIKGNAYVVTTHYRTDIEKAGRLELFDGRVLNIRSIANMDYKNRKLEIIADDGR